MSMLKLRSFLHLLCLLALLALLAGCQSPNQAENAILIGIKPEAVAALKNPQAPDPRDTGLASLDALNVKWGVKAMMRVFDVSPADEAAVKAGLAGVYKLSEPSLIPSRSRRVKRR
ncbi:MAG: hypothetical protein KatS3mg053_2532 [Candidatus Roseilinea sp.]|nr:MAG: hypothetical protein KatS3mg053_2532 [Candidatus Roseilinea sp.]